MYQSIVGNIFSSREGCRGGTWVIVVLVQNMFGTIEVGEDNSLNNWGGGNIPLS